MNNIKRFFTYLWHVVKDVFMLLCVALDIIGVILVYKTNIDIPSWVYPMVLAVGFLIANYKIYVDNAPEITVNTSLLNKYPYKVRAVGNSYVDLMVNYNLYLQNSSNNAGVVEKITVEMQGFSKCKDQFLLDKVGIKYKEFFIAEEELFTPLDFMKHTLKIETKFPIIIEPKALVKKVLILYIDIAGENEEDYKNTLAWMRDIEFVMTVDVKNNNVEKRHKYKIKVSKNDIEQARVREKKSMEDLDTLFEEMDA